MMRMRPSRLQTALAWLCVPAALISGLVALLSGLGAVLAYQTVAAAEANPVPRVLSAADPTAPALGAWVSLAARPVPGSDHTHKVGWAPAIGSDRLQQRLAVTLRHDVYRAVQPAWGRPVLLVQNRHGRLYRYWQQLGDLLLPGEALRPVHLQSFSGHELGLVEPVPPAVEQHYRDYLNLDIAGYAINVDRQAVPLPLAWRNFLLALLTGFGALVLAAAFWRRRRGASRPARLPPVRLPRL